MSTVKENKNSPPKLRIEYRAPSELSAYEKNARTHPEEQIEALAKAIEEFGFTNPVLVNADNVIRAGHARVQAALKLRMAKVPVIVLTHLSEAQQRALVLADNRISEGSAWDTNLLSEELKALHEEDFDLELLGFDEKELEELLNREDEQAAAEGQGETEDETHMRRITVTPEQYAIVEQTLIKFRELENDANISIGRTLELVCGDWLSGH